MSGRLIALVGAASVLLAMSPMDLDVDLPTGSPFDSIKIPKDTPTGGNPNDTASGGGGNKPPPPTGKPGETMAEDPKKAPPPKPPAGLPGVSAPSTIDYQQHLKWTPKDDTVEWRDPTGGATPTGPGAAAGTDPMWENLKYPPTVPNDLYVYGVTRFLMVMVHPAQVNERELTQFLIEMGYPAYHAATAARGETRLKRMADAITSAVGPMVKDPPAKPAGAVAQKVYVDLLSHYVYESGFGAWILEQPTEVTFPVLLDILKSHKHPFLLRNAAFILRCYNNPEVVPVLRDLLMKTPDKVIRNRALAALVRWQDEQIVPWLLKQAGGPDVSFRSYATWALGRIGHVSALDGLMSLVRQSAGDGEFLWSAIPALAWIGENAPPDKRTKVQDLLLQLERQVAGIKDPARYEATAPLMDPRVPDPPNSYSKILAQRIRIALARLKRPAEVALVKKMAGSDVLQPNQDFHQETVTKLEE